MNEQTQEKIFQYVDAIALKLGVAADHVYGILVKQAIVSGVVNGFIITLLPMVFLFITIWCSKKVNWSADTIDKDQEGFAYGAFACGFFFLITFVIWCVIAPDQFMKIFNPEYFAIKEILNAVK